MNKETKISRDNLNDNKSSDNNNNNSSSRISSSSAHKPAHNSDSINRALERAISDEQFLNSAIKLLLKDDDRRRMQFPAFKKNILDHVRGITKDTDIISLFESLDGYIKFKDAYHVQKALEENIPAKKTVYQITDKTREHPNARTRNTDSSRSIKEREAVNKSEERKDYPEVTPTAMSEYICNICGKSFQNNDDLIHHQHFETEEMKKNNKK